MAQAIISGHEIGKTFAPVRKQAGGFRSRRSLAYVKSEDLDSFFPSPDIKLLLAERCVLEGELNDIKTETHCQPNQCSHLEPK